MKRRFSALLSCIALFAVVGVTSANAQFRAGLIYGSETEVGITAGFYFPLLVVADNVQFGLDGAFYFPNDDVVTGEEVRTTFVEGNGNLHLDLANTPMLRLYGLAGFHYALIYTEVSGRTGLRSSDEGEFGANIGIGATARFLFGEIRYSVGGFDQVALTLGVNL